MIFDGHSPQTITAAARALLRGELIGLPTETVYGLAADASNDAAVAKIFQTKGRPTNHPLIVHVASAQAATRYASAVPDFAQKLMDAFWPGPLTLILPRRPGMVALAAGGQHSVGLRCPAHPIAQAILQSAQALGVQGVAAPSANVFGRVSPTTAQHVASEFGPELLIVDGGACAVGIESTIVDCTRAAPVLLRPGVLTAEQLSAACGVAVTTPVLPDAQAPRVSGSLESHYAPNAQVQLMSTPQLRRAIQALPTTPALAIPKLAIWHRSPITALYAPQSAPPSSQIAWQAMPLDAQQCAHQLFAQLRAFDDQGVTHIWVEVPPLTPEWAGVQDRLTRAASPNR